jgi:hypothetical protein
VAVLSCKPSTESEGEPSDFLRYIFAPSSAVRSPRNVVQLAQSVTCCPWDQGIAHRNSVVPSGVSLGACLAQAPLGPDARRDLEVESPDASLSVAPARCRCVRWRRQRCRQEHGGQAEHPRPGASSFSCSSHAGPFYAAGGAGRAAQGGGRLMRAVGSPPWSATVASAWARARPGCGDRG